VATYPEVEADEDSPPYDDIGRPAGDVDVPEVLPGELAGAVPTKAGGAVANAPIPERFSAAVCYIATSEKKIKIRRTFN